MSTNIPIDIRRECQLRFDDYLLSSFGRWAPDKVSISADDIYLELSSVKCEIIKRKIGGGYTDEK